MNIKFKKITLHNFMSFEHSSLDLCDMGYTIVVGRNNCKLDSALSNGSGKSSIFNGICFALTGETSNGLSKGVENIFGDPNDCWVELDFYVDRDHFIIKRFRTPNSNLKIYLNDRDISGKGIKESTKVLEDYLPDLTSELLSSVIILGQGMPNRFSNNHPKGRKEVLEKLTKSDFMIQSIRDKLDLRLAELKSQQRDVEDKYISTTSQLNVYTEQLTTISAEYDQYKNVNISDTLKALNTDLTSLENELSTIITEDEKLNDRTKLLNDTILQNNIDYNTDLDNNTKDLKLEKDKLTLEYTELLGDIKAEEKELKRLSSLKGVCPTCGQKIPENNHKLVEQTQAKINTLTLRREDINAKLSKLTLDIETIGNDLVLARKAETTDIYNELESIRLTLSKNSIRKNELLNNKISINKDIAKYTELNNTLSKLEQSIITYRDKINELTDININTQAELVVVKSHVDVVQQMNSLAKRDFRGELLRSIIDYINKVVKVYSQRVFGNTLLSFVLHENDIDVMFGDKLYESLSGGEKQKVDIIIQLALRELLSNQLNIHSNILVVDEILDNLDSVGSRAILDLFQGFNDIESLFFISHHGDELNISYDNIVTVTKNESGVSTIA